MEVVHLTVYALKYHVELWPARCHAAENLSYRRQLAVSFVEHSNLHYDAIEIYLLLYRAVRWSRAYNVSHSFKRYHQVFAVDVNLTHLKGEFLVGANALIFNLIVLHSVVFSFSFVNLSIVSFSTNS